MKVAYGSSPFERVNLIQLQRDVLLEVKGWRGGACR